MPLLPRDWSMMAADFIKQVRMMPLKKILTQSRAYSVYSGLLFFPKREITKSGASSKIRKKTVPIARTIFVIVLIVSFTRSTFPAPILKPMIGWPPRLIPITMENPKVVRKWNFWSSRIKYRKELFDKKIQTIEQ